MSFLFTVICQFYNSEPLFFSTLKQCSIIICTICINDSRSAIYKSILPKTLIKCTIWCQKHTFATWNAIYFLTAEVISVFITIQATLNSVSFIKAFWQRKVLKFTYFVVNFLNFLVEHFKMSKDVCSLLLLQMWFYLIVLIILLTNHTFAVKFVQLVSNKSWQCLFLPLLIASGARYSFLSFKPTINAKLTKKRLTLGL